MRFHREGWATLAVILMFDGILLWITNAFLPDWALWPAVALALLLFAIVINFFRYPHRRVRGGQLGDVLCPSDGKVVVIEEVDEPEWFQDRRIQVSIFMSPLNVHAQWAPMDGEVKYTKHHSGQYLVAWHPKSSTENERSTHVIEGPHGTVLFRQIAGALARRICAYMEPGQFVAAGDEVGFIKFGSRIDVFLPLDAEVKVKIGDVVKGKVDVLARLNF
ncbi:MAG: phosphatidylserine decarboxylase family protein [Flavobacteriales bacterium]